MGDVLVIVLSVVGLLLVAVILGESVWRTTRRVSELFGRSTDSEDAHRFKNEQRKAQSYIRKNGLNVKSMRYDARFAAWDRYTESLWKELGDERFDEYLNLSRGAWHAFRLG